MNKNQQTTRRHFITSTLEIFGTAIISPFNLLKEKALNTNQVIGHGNFKYKIDQSWGNPDPDKTTVNNCHEMVMDRKGRYIPAIIHRALPPPIVSIVLRSE